MINLTINGNVYPYPEVGDESWGDDATNWAVAVTTGMLQKSGGLFQLLAELDFGSTHGIKSLYYKTRTSNPASAGSLRLANTDDIAWRNSTNDGNLLLNLVGDSLYFNGSPIVTGNGGITQLTGDVTAGPGYGSVIATIANGAITTTKIQAGAVQEANIANNAITTNKISNSAVTLAKLADIPSFSFIGNNTGSSATPLALTMTQATALIQNYVGASASLNGTKGLVPAATAGQQNRFLKGDGTWVALPITYSDTNTIDLSFSGTTLTGSVRIGSGSSPVAGYKELLLYSHGDGLYCLLSNSAVQDIVTSASSSTRGLLTSTDWSTFNSKQPAGNYITDLTGDVTASGPGSASTTIANAAVSLAKMANLAANSIIGNNTGSSATPLALTGTQVTAMLDSMVGDSGSGGTKGLVPAPVSGDAAAGKYLKADGTWAVPPGGSSGITQLTGDVTAGPGSGSQVATIGAGKVTNTMLAGNIDLTTKVTGALPISNGGTGATSALNAFNALSPLTTVGDILIRDGSNNKRLAGNTTSIPMYLKSLGVAGVATEPVWEAIPNSGSATYILSEDASDISTYYELVALSAYVAGALKTVSTTVTTTATLMGAFATNTGYPNSTVIPAGVLSIHYETQKASGSNNYHTFFELYKRSAGGTETLLATSDNTSSSASNQILQNTAVVLITNDISILATDRLVIKIYGQMNSSSASIDLIWDNGTDARLTMPSVAVDTTNFVPYVGAQANVNLGTKTITAGNLSGTNTGDQTITLTGDVTGSGTGSFSATISNNAITTGKIVDSAITTAKLATNSVSTSKIIDRSVSSSKIELSGVLTNNINDGAVTLAKMANLAANCIIGNNTGSAAVPLALSTSQVTAMLDSMVGDSGSGGTKGLVPAPASGDAAAGKYLKADGTWAVPPGGSGGGITALTGDVTASGTGSVSATISNSAVTLAKMANLAANSIIGNNTGSLATPLALTGTQVTAMLNTFVGDSGSGGTKGLVPAPASGDSSKFLKADGTWATVSGGGDLQDAYDAGIPEIVVANTTTGAVVFKDSSSNTNRSNIIEIKKNSGAVIFAIDKDKLSGTFYEDYAFSVASITSNFTITVQCTLQRINNIIIMEGQFEITKTSGSATSIVATLTLPFTTASSNACIMGAAWQRHTSSGPSAISCYFGASNVEVPIENNATTVQLNLLWGSSPTLNQVRYTSFKLMYRV